MKILHTADWHIGQFKGPVEDGVNLRSLDTVKCLEFMVETAKEVHPDLVCVSGDIFHQEQIGPVRYSDEMVTATRIIEDLSECAKFVAVMRGTPNHDGAGQFRVLTKMLEKNKKVAVITTPQVISTPIADIACIPGFDKQEFRARFPGLSSEEENTTWTRYISDMVMGLRAQCSPEREKPSILMAHYTVPGCNMESGQTSFFSNFEPVIPREALQTADYSATLLGHIHRPQIIEGLDNVFYSGAINAMNFNDEGQSRGFWIHEFERGKLKSGHRYETPFREFQTVTWTQEDVESYLREGKIFLMNEKYPDLVSDKIVRIKYSCTSEQKKALNIPVLQSDLYDMGAFYVADIEAESMVEIANRGLLSEESDPLVNLKKWLSEKCVKNADKVVELGEPIIAAALKSESIAENHGVLRPVSISVKNYRNYKEETFDFSDVREKAQEYQRAVTMVTDLAPVVAEYESGKRSLEEKESQIQRYENIINTTQAQNRRIEEQLLEIEDADVSLIDKKLAELEEKRKELTAVREKKDRCAAISSEVNQKHAEVTESVHQISTQLKLAEADLAAYKKQQAFMEDSGCPDIANATCRFLEKAREDVGKIAQVEKDIASMQEAIRIAKEDYAAYAGSKKKEMSEIGYSPEEERKVLEEISDLELFQKKKEEAEQKKALRARLEGEKESNDKTIGSCMENVSTVKIESQKITETVCGLLESVKKYEEAKRTVDELRIYADQETNIPVYEERKKHLEEKRSDLKERENRKNDEWTKIFSDFLQKQELLSGIPQGKEEHLHELEKKKADLEKRASELQLQKGILIQRSEDVMKIRKEMDELKIEISKEAELASHYDVLKQAFSQDGVPHQIVRNIIPHITDTANNILGQMTGGTMGVEFVMERTVKGKDGDKATLDVLIAEYGKTTLPYASKSGGEKVKASLAVILALSEIKATAAGIQLGMLFIDEPPFLDDDGAQAYVDSLETIRSRYPDVKIMAITHDDAMKARFSQSITVIKTDDGSKVIY